MQFCYSTLECYYSLITLLMTRVTITFRHLVTSKKSGLPTFNSDTCMRNLNKLLSTSLWWTVLLKILKELLSPRKKPILIMKNQMGSSFNWMKIYVHQQTLSISLTLGSPVTTVKILMGECSLDNSRKLLNNMKETFDK